MRMLSTAIIGMGAGLAAFASACVASDQTGQLKQLPIVAVGWFAGEGGYLGTASYFQRAPLSQYAQAHRSIGENLEGYRLVLIDDFVPGLLVGLVQSSGRRIARELEFVTTDKTAATWQTTSEGHPRIESHVKTEIVPLSAESYATLVSKIDLKRLAAFFEPPVIDESKAPKICLHPAHVYFEVYDAKREAIASRSVCDPDFKEFVAALTPFFDEALVALPSPPEEFASARSLVESVRRPNQN